MEELNEKIIFPNKFLGSEFGIARYQRISNYDFSPHTTTGMLLKSIGRLFVENGVRYYLKRKCVFSKKLKANPCIYTNLILLRTIKKDPDNNKAYENVNETVNKFLTNNC